MTVEILISCSSKIAQLITSGAKGIKRIQSQDHALNMISWGLFSSYVIECLIFPSTEHAVFSLWSYDHQPWFSSSSYFLVNPCSHEQVVTYWRGHQGLYAFAMRIFLWHIHRGCRLQVLLTIPWLVLPRARTMNILPSFFPNSFLKFSNTCQK